MMKIEFVKWRDYLTRGDLSAVQWIKLPTNIINSKRLYGLTAETKWLLFYFACEAGLQNDGGALDLEIEYAAHHSGCSIITIFDSAHLLAKRGFFSLVIDTDTIDLVDKARHAETTRKYKHEYCEFQKFSQIELLDNSEIRADRARPRADRARPRADCARTRADCARTRADPGLGGGFGEELEGDANDGKLNTETRNSKPESCEFENYSQIELLDNSEIRADRARPRAERARPRAGSVPREEKKREEKKREEESKEEGVGETTFDADPVGSLSLANSGSKKSKTQKVQVMDLSDAELELGTDWLKLAVTHFPNRVSDPKWTPHLFALELRKVANVCSYSMADMRKILEHIKHDTFWSPKAACPSGLLKKGSNGLRKIENIFVQTKSKAQIKDAVTSQDWAENPEKAAEWQEMLEWIGGKKP